MEAKRVIIFDTTLRDGEQSPGASLNKMQKLEIARQLARLGVDIIEAGFPVTSQGDFEAVRAIADSVKGPVIAGLARANEKDIEICGKALKNAVKRRIHTFIATSDIHLKHKLRKTRDEVLELACKAVRYAKKFTDDVEFSAEDAVRTDFKYLCRVIEEVIKEGAKTINIPDTVGYAIPEEFGNLIKNLILNVRDINKVVISVHCHNDLGLSVSNSISAIISGARQVECTINGIGERAGNASLEEIVMIMKTRSKYFREFGILPPEINTKEIYRTSKLVSSLTGIPVQPNKAIVGSNAFAHEAGIHQDGVLKKSITYEIITPQTVGIPSSKLILGKHSGRHALMKRLIELGFKIQKNKIDKIYNEFKKLADKKKYIFDEDLISLVEEKSLESFEFLTLEYFHISSGSGIIPTATICVKLNMKNKKIILQEASYGDGPVDAAYKAIDTIVKNKLKVKVEPKLIDYSLRSISGGKDAQGEVTVRVKFGNIEITGRGASTDIIEASIKAYLNCLNKILNQKNISKKVETL